MASHTDLLPGTLDVLILKSRTASGQRRLRTETGKWARIALAMSTALETA